MEEKIPKKYVFMLRFCAQRVTINQLNRVRKCVCMRTCNSAKTTIYYVAIKVTALCPSACQTNNQKKKHIRANAYALKPTKKENKLNKANCNYFAFFPILMC